MGNNGKKMDKRYVDKWWKNEQFQGPTRGKTYWVKSKGGNKMGAPSISFNRQPSMGMKLEA